MKKTVSDFILFHQSRLLKLQSKKPTKSSVKEFFYMSGMIDAAKLIRKELKLK
jgi:hypothetical protein